MARKSYSRNSGLVELALAGPWSMAAILSLGMLLIGNVILPATLGKSPFTAPMAAMFRPLINLGALGMGIVAVFKFIREKHLLARQSPVSATSKPSASPSTAPPPSQPAPLQSDKPTEWSLALLQRIEWKRFEDLCAAIYQAKGIRCAVTPLGPDGGIDIRLFQGEDDRTTTVVQCKAWPEQKVGVKLIRELLGVKFHEKAAKAFFMTCGGYTEEAIAFAKKNQIMLFNGDMMLMMLKLFPQDTQQKLLAFATAGDYTTPTCPSCGLKMVERSSHRGRFWGCRSYPNCRGMLHIKKHRDFNS